MRRGRKFKSKDSTASLLSLTGTAASVKKDSSNSEVIIMSKKVVEKLGFLVAQHQDFVEKSNKQLYSMANSNKTLKLCELLELLTVHKGLMSRSELGLNDARFIIDLGEVTDALEANRLKIRTEAKRFSVENKELKTKLTYLINRLIEMEGSLARVKEEMKHWETLSKIRLLDGEGETDKVEKQIWRHSINDENKEPNIPDTVSEILDLINEGDIQDAVDKYSKQLSQVQPKPNVDEAGLICLVAKRVSEEEQNERALELIDIALKFRKISLGIPSIAYAHTLTTKALIHFKMSNNKLACQFAFEAMQCMEGSLKNDRTNINIGRQYIVSGFLLANWGHPLDGILMMEMGFILFENHLPGEELLWMDAIIKIGRTCNNFKYYDDALLISCELLDYFHERVYGTISKKNQPIYEVAAECQKADTASAKLISMNGPKPTYISNTVANALREIIIGFSSRYEFGAAKVIEKYLKDCLSLNDYDFNEEDSEMTPETKQNIIQRRQGRKNLITPKKLILNLKDPKFKRQSFQNKLKQK